MEYYRIDLTKKEWEELRESLKFKIMTLANLEIYKKINSPKIIKKSDKKIGAVKIANMARTKNAKKKINAAIQLMIFENKKMSYNSIATVSGVAHKTVAKYLTTEKLILVNKNIK